MNIFVGNLPESVGTEALRKLFSRFGVVLNTKVATDTKQGRHGNVYLVPDAAARTAILELDLTELEGHQITVRECTWREKHERREKCIAWSGPERRRREDRRSDVAVAMPPPATRSPAPPSSKARSLR